jgi:hypothetical protein
LSILLYATPIATYLDTTPDPQSKTNESPFPNSTKTLLQAWLGRGVYQVPKNEIRISSGPGGSINNIGGTAVQAMLGAAAMGPPAVPEIDNPPKANPQSFNASRLVSPLAIVFLKGFVIASLSCSRAVPATSPGPEEPPFFSFNNARDSSRAYPGRRGHSTVFLLIVAQIKARRVRACTHASPLGPLPAGCRRVGASPSLRGGFHPVGPGHSPLAG